MESLPVLEVPRFDLAAWRPELMLAVTALAVLVLARPGRRAGRWLTLVGLAVAAGLALPAGAAREQWPLGVHFAVDPVVHLVRQAATLGALAVWLSWSPRDVRAGGGLALSALGTCWLAAASTVGGLLLAVATLVTGGSLLAWLGATGAAAHNAVGRWHRTATLGFAGLAAALALLAGLSGSLDLSDLLADLAGRPDLPPLALPLLLGLAAVALALALLGEPGRFHAAGEEALPPAATAWLTAAPALALAGPLARMLGGVRPVPLLAGLPDLAMLLGGALVLGGFAAALAQDRLVRRLAWGAAGQVGLVLLLAASSSAPRPDAMAAALRVFAAAQLASLLLAGVLASDRLPGRLRAPLTLLLAVSLLSLAAVPPLAGWSPRLVLLDGLLAAERWAALAVAVLGTVLGHVVYLRPLVGLVSPAAAGSPDAAGSPEPRDPALSLAATLSATALAVLLLAWGLGWLSPTAGLSA